MASITKRPDGRWRARYRDVNGKEHAKHFDRKIDGQRWLGQITAALVTGQYVDPRAGRITFAGYYDTWASRQVWESTTGQAMSLAARSATFAEMPLGNVRRSHVEQWVKQMTTAGLQQARSAPAWATCDRFFGLLSATESSPPIRPRA